MIIEEVNQTKVGVQFTVSLREREPREGCNIFDGPEWPRFRNMAKQIISQRYTIFKGYTLVCVECIGSYRGVSYTTTQYKLTLVENINGL